MANGIVVRTHGQNMVDIIDLEDGSPHRRHIDQVRFRADVRQEEPESPKPEQLERMELKAPPPAVKDNAEHTQNSDEPINDSDVGKTENQVEDATKSNDESEERLEPHRLHPQYGVEDIDRLKVLYHGDPKGFAK